MASFEDGGVGGELWIGEHDLSFDGFGGIAHEKCREMVGMISSFVAVIGKLGFGHRTCMLALPNDRFDGSC